MKSTKSWSDAIPTTLLRFQLGPEQRELGRHVDGSGKRRLPVPAQSITKRDNGGPVKGMGKDSESWI